MIMTCWFICRVFLWFTVAVVKMVAHINHISEMQPHYYKQSHLRLIRVRTTGEPLRGMGCCSQGGVWESGSAVFFCVCVLSISPVYLVFLDPTDSRCKKATFWAAVPLKGLKESSSSFSFCWCGTGLIGLPPTTLINTTTHDGWPQL